MTLKKFLIWTSVTVVLLLGAVFGVWRILCSATHSGEAVRIYIPANSTSDAVADTLASNLGSFGNKTARLWRLLDAHPEVAHGSYLVEDGTKAIALARAIAQGRQTPVRLTVNNMRTIGDLAARVGAKLEFDSAAFIAAADTLLPAAGFDTPNFPAAFLPDTYEYYWTASPETVINNMLRVRNNFWNVERRGKAAALGLTPEQVASIAAIVEEESNMRDERPVIARLYLNRLEKDMPLQADPTVKFAVGDFSLRRITSAHLAIESPYNTYRNTGLTPGPIRIAERASIDDVLNAPPHDYLYMCARSDFSGYHDFATTYDRHRINAARYHRALNARGL